MLEIDYTLFIQIANFLFLLFVLNIILYRPIRGILNRRKEEMTSTEDQAVEWSQKADKFSEELKENTSKTRQEGLIEKEDLKNEGLQDERVMLQDASATAEENLLNARDEIQERLAQVRQSLQAEVKGFSQELAEKILGRTI
jgi:F-type H+-transporting ATPase subunit b